MGVAAVGLLAVAVTASACTNKGTSDDTKGGTPVQGKLVYVNDAKGPAPEIAGAKKGGILKIKGSADFDRGVQVQATYRGDGIMVLGQLAARTLTSYYEDNGQIKVMGDLATNTGEESDSCKTWTYHLRDNIKFQDGSAITSKDIAYGISRAFDEGSADGPTYLQRWLAGNDKYDADYTGPYKNPGKLAPGIELPDDKTIVFKMKDAHCDFPLAAALLTDVPIPAATDPGATHDDWLVSSGPYMLKTYKVGEKAEWVKNPNWDPTSDPLRHQYVDGYVFDWTASDPDVVTKEIVADQGDAQSIIQWDNPSTAGLLDITDAVKNRVIEGDTVFSITLNINTIRVKDVDTRRAIIYAYNKAAVLQIIGGEKAGTPSTTLTPPVTPGYKKFDAYPAPLTGDPEKAKGLLKGATPTLTYCHRAGGVRPKVAAAVKEALARAGITIVIKELDATVYYPTVGKKSTECDLIPGGWGQDYPDSSTVLGVIANGTEAKDAGSNNLSYLDVPEVNDKLKLYSTMPDRTAAATLYGNLEEEIFKNYAPWVPIYYDHSYSINGSKVGGVYLSGLWGSPSLQNAFVN